MSHDGDSRISSHDIKLWSIHREIVRRWSVYTIFKYAQYNVPEGRQGVLLWLVPGDLPERHEIITWLEYELETFKEEPMDIHDTHFPGVRVKIQSHILLFSGVCPYLGRDEAERFVSKMLEEWSARFKKEDK